MKGHYIKGNNAAAVAKTNHVKHGMGLARALLQGVKLHGSRSRSFTALMSAKHPWSTALREWKDSLVVSLGGWDNMNPISHEILAQVTVTKIIVDSMAAYALTNPPINRAKHRVFPWVLQRDRLVGSYMGLLKALRESVKDQRKPTAFDPSLDGHLEGGQDGDGNT